MLFSSSVGKIVFHMRSLLRRALHVYIGVKCLPYKTLNIKHKLAIFMLNMALTKSSLFWTAVLPVLRNVVHVWNKFHVGIASHQQYIWCFSVNLHSNITGNRAVYILSRHQHSTEFYAYLHITLSANLFTRIGPYFQKLPSEFDA